MSSSVISRQGKVVQHTRFDFAGKRFVDRQHPSVQVGDGYRPPLALPTTDSLSTSTIPMNDLAVGTFHPAHA